MDSQQENNKYRSLNYWNKRLKKKNLLIALPCMGIDWGDLDGENTSPEVWKKFIYFCYFQPLFGNFWPIFFPPPMLIWMYLTISGYHRGGSMGASAPWQQKICQQSGKGGGKSGKIGGGEEEKTGRKVKNWEGSFTLPLLTDRAGYATAHYAFCWWSDVM